MPKIYSVEIGGRDLHFETGKLAQQASGSVLVRYGETAVLVTAVMSDTVREGIDFLPLTVDYEERLYAAGKIPGSFFRREGRSTEAGTLTCRLVDRPLRPLLPKGLRNEVQIVLTALSADHEHQLDILFIIGASAAMMISDIPFAGPVGAIRMGYAGGKLLFNPTMSEMETSLMDLRLAGTKDAIVMVEAGASEVSEDVILQALEEGQRAYQDVIRMQEELQAAAGKAKREFQMFSVGVDLRNEVEALVGGRIMPALEAAHTKEQREKAVDDLRAEALGAFGEASPRMEIQSAFEDCVKHAVRTSILERGYRPDGRAIKEIRPIQCEVGFLPRTHGSGLFSRGETQVLTIATLGTSSDEQIIDSLDAVEDTKRYMHHYNFPPYSTGEVRGMRGPGRREIGHGALAERALTAVLPAEERFPYTIRLVSEVLSSNGSTSMASTCASTLALMDAGVPIKAPVSGIAMGLVSEENRYAVLSDIQGMEDFLGDMDFKVTGTAQGITALQMDLKLKGINMQIMREALEQAREGRSFILDKMLATIPAARAELSPYAPRITMIRIDPEKIGALIGPGGKTIRGIVEQTGTKIDVQDDGTVCVASANGTSSERAIAMVRALTETPEIGKIYTGRVVRITDFGAFVEILPGTDGLVHISQLADFHVNKVEDVVKAGDEIMVMIIDIDRDGKIRLSRQAVLQGWTPEEARERDNRNRSSGRPSSGPSRPYGGGGPSNREGRR